MNLVEINFGSSRAQPKAELEDVAETYIASLFKAGQLCGEYFMTWMKGQLIGHVLASGLGAERRQHHSDWGKANLKKVIQVFGQAPVWTQREDERPKRNISLNAPTLHLFTHAFDWKPPVSRGDTGQCIPTFLLPIQFQAKEAITGWQDEYVLHDRMWLNSGSLEIAAYKELTDPSSELSSAGREICATIENATKIPVYYFLIRYYTLSQGDDDRPCPGCGGEWQCDQPADAPFHHWPFRCEPCRLVSTVGVNINKRLAKIGQWKQFKK